MSPGASSDRERSGRLFASFSNAALGTRKSHTAGESIMAHSFDATLKDLLEPQPEDFVPAFGLPTTRPVIPINIDLSTISAATDVAMGFGDPLQEIVDLNFQSGPDREVAQRCHLYNAALNFRFGVPVRTIIVLLRPKADAKEIIGKLAYASGCTKVEFTYEVVRMWQQPLEPFLTGGVNLLPLATLCQMPAGRTMEEGLRGVVRDIDRRLAAECEHAKAVRLMTSAFILTGLRVQRDALGSIYDGVRIMHESSAYDMIHDEGLAKGLAVGRTEGLTEGCIKGEQRLLLRLGRKRLGQPDEATIAALHAIKDLDRLERLGDAVIDVGSWQELLATL